MKRIITFIAIGTLLLSLNGCGSKPGAPETKLPPDMPSGGGGTGGGPPPPDQRPTVAMGGGGGGSTPAPAAGAAQPPADQAAQQQPSNISATGNVPRNLPRAAMGGGGGTSTPAPAATGPAPNNPSAGNVAGLANGLYPQGMTGVGAGAGGGGTIAGGLLNGLYPQFGGGSSAPTSTASNPAAPIPAAASALAGDSADAAAKQATAAVKLLDDAKDLYAAGEDDTAAKMLYAYLLAKEDAFETYPLEWYAGLKEPRAFLRMGIGVTYNRPRDFDGKPPVIGDPVAESRGGRRQGALPPGGGDIIGSTGAGGGPTGAASNSPYNTVDTTTPAGFLLYYTGDYVEKLYQELNSRRKGSKAQFGKILAQFPERVPTKPASQGEASEVPPAAPAGGPPANRPTIQMGGGGGRPAGGAPSPAAGGGAPAAGAGENQNAANRNQRARKLVDLWSGSDASPPERLTTGSLMPGVTCLGEGKKEELFSRAKKFGVDVVLIFDVRVGEAKGENYTTTTLRLFDPDNPEEQLALGRQLRNNLVMESRESGRDPVDGELARVIDEYIDQNLAATKLPDSLNQENVSKRIDAVLAKEVEHPLKAAVEVIGFYRVGLLPEDKVTTALNQLLGEELAEAILNGEESDRVAGLRKLVESD